MDFLATGMVPVRGATLKRDTAQLPLGIGLSDTARFETFHPGANASVVHTLRGAAAGTGERVAWLAGPPGSGRSHLLQAACAASDAAGRRSALLPLSLHAELDPSVMEGWEDFDLVCIDDLDQVAGDAAWAHALFALFNALQARGGSWIASGDEVPVHINCVLPDLTSRLASGPVFALRPLGDDDRLAALVLRARARGFELPDDAGRYLLKRVPRDMGSLYALLERLDEATLARQRRVTIPLLRELLEAGD